MTPHHQPDPHHQQNPWTATGFEQPAKPQHGTPQYGAPQPHANLPVPMHPPGGYPVVPHGQQGYGQPGHGYGQPGFAQPVYVMPLKSMAIAYLLWFFLGGLGIHHLYLGRTTPGIVMLLLLLVGAATAWIVVGIPLVFAVSIWLLVDLFLIPGYVRTANYRLTGMPQPY